MVTIFQIGACVYTRNLCNYHTMFMYLLLFIYLVDIHVVIVSKINCFRHRAFVHIHVLSLSKTSLVFCLNKDIVGATTTSDGKQFHSSTTHCVKKFALS